MGPEQICCKNPTYIYLQICGRSAKRTRTVPGVVYAVRPRRCSCNAYVRTCPAPAASFQDESLLEQQDARAPGNQGTHGIHPSIRRAAAAASPSSRRSNADATTARGRGPPDQSTVNLLKACPCTCRVMPLFSSPVSQSAAAGALQEDDDGGPAEDAWSPLPWRPGLSSSPPVENLRSGHPGGTRKRTSL